VNSLNAMSLGERWMRRPQSTWLRKALFQVHLWIGVGLGVYVLIISISGSAIVFRNEISKAFSARPRIVATSGPRLSRGELKQAVTQAYPADAVAFIFESNRANEATEVWLDHDGKHKTRLFDPYTGKDLGDSVPFIIHALTWMIDLHINLLSGKTGRTLNGIGAIFVTLLALSGAVVWWPGIVNWRGSLAIRRDANWKRLNWNLHSAVGIWSFAFVLIWGVTGIYVVFPEPFERTINHFSPLQLYRLDVFLQSPGVQSASSIALGIPLRVRAQRRTVLPPIERSTGDKILRWLYYLHFGNFGSWPVKLIWVVLGLAPPFLFVTGVLMWWNRVLAKLPERSEVPQIRTRELESTG
jgi:uncharacterized iron-regulated membrane protein